jgi:hypothetical protein
MTALARRLVTVLARRPPPLRGALGAPAMLTPGAGS